MGRFCISVGIIVEYVYMKKKSENITTVEKPVKRKLAGIVTSTEVITTEDGTTKSIHQVNGAKGGQPLKFATVEELEQKIQQYFASLCYIEETTGRTVYHTAPTMTGLAEELDTSREVLSSYSEKNGYADSIRKAKLKCERYAEEQLFTNPRTAGVIFNMVNNYGWQNRYNQDSTIQVQQTNTITPTNTQILQNIQNIQEQLEKGDE